MTRALSLLEFSRSDLFEPPPASPLIDLSHRPHYRSAVRSLAQSIDLLIRCGMRAVPHVAPSDHRLLASVLLVVVVGRSAAVAACSSWLPRRDINNHLDPTISIERHRSLDEIGNHRKLHCRPNARRERPRCCGLRHRQEVIDLALARARDRGARSFFSLSLSRDQQIRSPDQIEGSAAPPPRRRGTLGVVGARNANALVDDDDNNDDNNSNNEIC